MWQNRQRFTEPEAMALSAIFGAILLAVLVVGMVCLVGLCHG